MPRLRIINGRTNTRQVTAQFRDGSASLPLAVVPNSFTLRGDNAEVERTPRSGRKPLTRVAGQQARQIGFSTRLGYTDWHRSVDLQLNRLRRAPARGVAVRFTNMPSVFAGWWLVESFNVDVEQLTPDNRMSRVTLHWQLVELVDAEVKLSRTPPPRRKPPARQPVGSTYTVKSGDSLSLIALRKLGNAMRWPEIFNLNRSQIKNPNLIYPGQKFRLPPR
ncbi:LysM peptidoglycan-binding domain-containing protein [Nesterenkonia rhizosphaerae]|uniref:LysM domain-containing protein n=1 Tax=Nesterenkonia rhizosphaerae TaxID=1348272 RepID=A0ABP9FSW1_9MICC